MKFAQLFRGKPPRKNGTAEQDNLPDVKNIPEKVETTTPEPEPTQQEPTKRETEPAKKKPVPVTKPEPTQKLLIRATQNGGLAAALTENGKLVEYRSQTERGGKHPLVPGTILVGTVNRPHAGVAHYNLETGDTVTDTQPTRKRSNAVFVNLPTKGSSGLIRKAGNKTRELGHGDPVLCQVVTTPHSGKGYALTTRIALAGRYLIHLPQAGTGGVSKRLNKKQRTHLRNMMKTIPGKFIARTTAAGKPESVLRAEARQLRNRWAQISADYQNLLEEQHGPVTPKVLHNEDWLSQVLRDQLTQNVSVVKTSSKRVETEVQDRLVNPTDRQKVRHHKKVLPDWDSNVKPQIEAALQRRAALPSGGDIVIAETEACVTIDVNSGATSGENQTEVALRTNLEAAHEIGRQLRLRRIGGVIVVDFITITDPDSAAASAEAITSYLKTQLKKDPAPTSVGTMSALWLLEITRKRVGPSLAETLLQTCGTCEGHGRVKREKIS